VSSPPPTPTPRRPGRPAAATAAESESVRDRLLDAATALAIEQGFDASGLREIAARAGVSSGMVAYYFGDRSGLNEAMFARALDQAGGQLRGLLDEGHEALDTLDAFVQLHVRILAANPWIPQFIAREVLTRETQHRDHFAAQIRDGPMRILVDWIEAAMERGELRSDLDPRLCALSLASLSAFPFLLLPVIGEEFGLTLDDLSPERLIEHNRALLNFGVRAQLDEAE
jgi:AcrR family transcriptional regulator